jgi:hypothetical protein
MLARTKVVKVLGLLVLIKHRTATKEEYSVLSWLGDMRDFR